MHAGGNNIIFLSLQFFLVPQKEEIWKEIKCEKKDLCHFLFQLMYLDIV